MWKFDSVIVSDLHLGARNSRAGEFLRFLDTISAETLIINGDIFDSNRLRGLEGCHVEVLGALRRLTSQTKIRWLIGNHDPAPHWFQDVLGVKAEHEIDLEIGDKRYYLCHGHRWDGAMHLPWFVVEGADAVYRGCQWLDPTHKLARHLKYKSKQFLKVAERMRNKAVTYARQHGYDGVIVGHTHMAGDLLLDGVHFLNSGCWTERPSNFVGVRQDVARVFSWEADVLPYARPVRHVAPAASLADPVSVPLLVGANRLLAGVLGEDVDQADESSMDEPGLSVAGVE